MRIRLLVIVIGGAFVVLAAWSLQLGATPALAQQTCPTGQTYCPSGTYAGQCRPNTASCPTGSVSATVGGCSTCSCPGGQVVCSGACQAPKRCSDPNRSTENQCAASDAASCGACASGYTLDTGTNTCVETLVKLAPSNPQQRSSGEPAINVVQGGTGLLFNLQMQDGADVASRRQIISADRTGLMIGYDSDTTKLGIDLSAAGGQNLIYAIARTVGLDAAFDSLLKLQMKEADGSISDRFRVDGSGNVVAAGSIRGSQLCIGADCKNSWSTVAVLQDRTPGTPQIGHFNISGNAYFGSLVVASGGIQAGSGNVRIIDSTGKIPALASTYFANLSGANLTSLNASNLASGTVSDARLPAGILRNPIDGGASNTGPWLTIQGGASVLANVALRLFDVGTADANINALEFAHNSGTSPVAVARVKSVNVGAKAASGAQLILETASNNTGTFNTDQLVLRTDGNVRVGNDLSLGGSDVIIDPGEHLNILAPNGDGHLGGLSRVRAGGMAISNNPNAAVPTRGLYVQGSVDFDSAATIASATVEGALTVGGDLSVTGSMTAANSYECVSVSSELRCTLRQQWRVADKQSGFVMSWVGSDTCTNVCTRAGLKTCSDIQFNYECPNGSFLNTNWRDDNPNEFGVGGRTCSSVEPYRATVSGITCPGQSGTEYKRYRCRCAS